MGEEGLGIAGHHRVLPDPDAEFLDDLCPQSQGSGGNARGLGRVVERAGADRRTDRGQHGAE